MDVLVLGKSVNLILHSLRMSQISWSICSLKNMKLAANAYLWGCVLHFRSVCQKLIFACGCNLCLLPDMKYSCMYSLWKGSVTGQLWSGFCLFHVTSCFSCSLANLCLVHPQTRTESSTQSEVHLYDHIHTAGNWVLTETQQWGTMHTLNRAQPHSSHCFLYCRS